VLNHILKNSIAGAASLVELEVQERTVSEEPHDLLDSALGELHSAISWCVSRQVMIDLSSGTYLTTHSPVGVTKFLTGLFSGTTSVDIKDSTQHVDIAFDEKLARLALENAKTNAKHHGDGNLLEVCAEFHEQGKMLHIQMLLRHRCLP